MDFDFVIPLNRNDLLHKHGVNNYVVDEVCPIRLLPGKIRGSVIVLFFGSVNCCNRGIFRCVCHAVNQGSDGKR